MTKVQKGGIDMWCPHCNAIRVCRADNPSTHGKPSGQRWYKISHTDVQWFRRGRTCTTCYSKWLTAELPESHVEELVRLRDFLPEIKAQATRFLAESRTAAASLAHLEKFLGDLDELR
jgi:hypothetical protein